VDLSKYSLADLCVKDLSQMLEHAADEIHSEVATKFKTLSISMGEEDATKFETLPISVAEVAVTV
jgi:hypothetical protein